MALRWDFREQSGTLTMMQNGKQFDINFYEGNAMMIAIFEFEEDGKSMYNLQWFFTDETHAKRCLGLAKGTENMFRDELITQMTIYRDHCRNWSKIANLFVKAFPHIQSTLLESKGD